MPIEQLDLSVRALNCLKREGIHEVGQLLLLSRATLMTVRNLGELAVEEIDSKVRELGFELPT